jgi:hypothetical protein
VVEAHRVNQSISEEVVVVVEAHRGNQSVSEVVVVVKFYSIVVFYPTHDEEVLVERLVLLIVRS